MQVTKEVVSYQSETLCSSGSVCDLLVELSLPEFGHSDPSGPR